MSVKNYKNMNNVHRSGQIINQSICQSNELWHSQTPSWQQRQQPKRVKSPKPSAVRWNARAMVAKIWCVCLFENIKKNRFGGVNKSIKVETLTQSQTYRKTHTQLNGTCFFSAFEHKNRGFWRRNVSLWLGYCFVTLYSLWTVFVLPVYEWCWNDMMKSKSWKRIEIDRFELWSLFRAAVEWILHVYNTQFFFSSKIRECRNRKQNSHSKRPIMYHYLRSEQNNFFFFFFVFKFMSGG